MSKKRVVIAGGGFGGIKAVEKMLRSNRDDFELILIDKNPYHYLQPDVYDFIANKYTLTDITISLVTFTASYCGRLQFIRAEVTGFDPARNIIITTNGEISYDYLIVALGSRTFFPKSIPGISEYAHGIKSIHWAFNFKQKFERMIYKKIEEDSCNINSDFNIVIAGGGLSGVEIAAAMAEYSTHFFKSSGYMCGGIKVYLIAGSKSVLAGQDPFLINTAMKRLDSLGVVVISGTLVSKVEEKAVHLANGMIIPMNYMIWTGGIMSAPVLATLDVEKTKMNYIIVDEKLKVSGYDNIFAIGDCAVMKDVDGNQLPPSAQSAEFSGIACAQNILNLLDGRELEDVKLKNNGVLVALGGKYAAAHLLKNIRLSGRFAYFIKSMISKFYKLPLDKRCKKGMKQIAR